MTERSMFWTDGGGDGGPYSQDQLRLLGQVVAGSFGANTGVAMGALNGLKVTSTGNNNVTVDTGAALVNGTFFTSDTSRSVTTASPVVGTTGRRVVLEKNWAARTVRIVVTSSADGTSAIPALAQTDGATWQIPLATFTITTTGVIGSLSDVREGLGSGRTLIKYSTAAQNFAATTTLVDVLASAGVVSFPVLANRAYLIEYDIYVSSMGNSGTSGIRFGLTGPSSPALLRGRSYAPYAEYDNMDTGGIRQSQNIPLLTLNGAIAFGTTFLAANRASTVSGGVVQGYVEGRWQFSVLLVVGSTGGTVTLQAAQCTAVATSTIGDVVATCTELSLA